MLRRQIKLGLLGAALLMYSQLVRAQTPGHGVVSGEECKRP